MQFGPQIVTSGLALNVDFANLYFNSEAASDVIFSNDALTTSNSNFFNWQSGTIDAVYEDGPFNQVETVSRFNTNNSGGGINNPWHVGSNFTSSELSSGIPYIADYFTKTTTDRYVRSNFTYDVNSATYTELDYGVHKSGQWKRILHHYSYTTGTITPRYFIVDRNDTPAGVIYNYRTRIYKFKPVNTAGDSSFTYATGRLKANVSDDNTIRFYGAAGSSNGPEYISFNDSYSLTSSANKFSYEILVSPTASTAADNIVMGKVGFNAGILQVGLSFGMYAWGYYSGYNQYASSSYATTVNNWYHMVGTYDSDVLRFYVNGNQVGSPSSTVTGILTYSNFLSIGGSADEANNKTYPYSASCKVALFRMYKGILSTSQIQSNFNTVRSRYNI